MHSDYSPYEEIQIDLMVTYVTLDTNADDAVCGNQVKLLTAVVQ